MSYVFDKFNYELGKLRIKNYGSIVNLGKGLYYSKFFILHKFELVTIQGCEVKKFDIVETVHALYLR